MENHTHFIFSKLSSIQFVVITKMRTTKMKITQYALRRLLCLSFILFLLANAWSQELLGRTTGNEMILFVAIDLCCLLVESISEQFSVFITIGD